MLDLIVRLQPRYCFEETGMRPCGVENENPSGFSINQQARVAIAVEPCARAHDLLTAPGATVVGTAAQQEIDRVGQIIKVRTAVIGSQDSPLHRDSEGRYSVLPVSTDPTDRQYVFDVGGYHRHWQTGEEVGCHMSILWCRSISVFRRGR